MCVFIKEYVSYRKINIAKDSLPVFTWTNSVPDHPLNYTRCFIGPDGSRICAEEPLISPGRLFPRIGRKINNRLGFSWKFFETLMSRANPIERARWFFSRKRDNGTLELLKITKAVYGYPAGVPKRTETGQNPIDLA